MSRCGYTDSLGDEGWELPMWRGQVASAIRGKRGQAFLREMVAALDALPEKRLIAHELQAGDHVCAVGAVGVRRGIDISDLDPESYDNIAAIFGIAHQLVQEIEYMNDDVLPGCTPERRWQFVRDWAQGLIRHEDTTEKPDAP